MLDIIYEDEKLIAVNKPAGLSVHPSRKEPDGTLVDMLLEQYPELAQVGEDPDRPGIVHRLDKDTSGLLVVAKTEEAFEGLKALFKGREVDKRYLAIVDGIIKEPRGTIKFPIGRVGLKMGIVRPAPKGRGSPRRAGRPGSTKLRKQRDAMTQYIVRKRFSDATLVEMVPKTGRMHQIRVHMHSIGRPVLGDRLYGGGAIRERAPRQMLHAWRLSFTLDGTEYDFETEPPDDFQEMLERLADAEEVVQDIGAD